MKIIKLKKTIKTWKQIEIFPKYLLVYARAIKIKEDLKKTWCLKTAIIEKECIKSLKSVIFDGPKYLNPRTELISLIFFKYFFTEPE